MAQGHSVLEGKLEELRDKDPREAAEYAFAIAELYKRDGNSEKAIQFGREAIALLDKVPTDSLKDCAGRNVLIGNVPIPGLFHQNVVRTCLQPLAI